MTETETRNPPADLSSRERIAQIIDPDAAYVDNSQHLAVLRKADRILAELGSGWRPIGEAPVIEGGWYNGKNTVLIGIRHASVKRPYYTCAYVAADDDGHKVWKDSMTDEVVCRFEDVAGWRPIEPLPPEVEVDRG